MWGYAKTSMTTGATIGWRAWVLAAAGWGVTSLLLTAGYLRLVRPDLRVWPGVVTHGRTDTHAMAVTFDDGPHPLWAPLLADTLERHGARGTFFLVGMQAALYPEIVDRLARAGHQIGNHSLNHPYPNLTVFPPARVAREISDAGAILRRLSGQPVTYFRPPGGGMNETVLAEVRRQHLLVGWWSANAADWGSTPSGVIEEQLLNEARPGQVILLHERENTVPALQAFCDHGAGGYSLVTLDALR